MSFVPVEGWQIADLSYRSTFDDEPGDADLINAIDIFEASNAVNQLAPQARNDHRKVLVIQTVRVIVLTPYNP
jgi:hypothetical protein